MKRKKEKVEGQKLEVRGWKVEVEDRSLAEEVLERIRSGKERTIPLKAVLRREGLGL